MSRAIAELLVVKIYSSNAWQRERCADPSVDFVRWPKLATVAIAVADSVFYFVISMVETGAGSAHRRGRREKGGCRRHPSRRPPSCRAQTFLGCGSEGVGVPSAKYLYEIRFPEAHAPGARIG